MATIGFFDVTKNVFNASKIENLYIELNAGAAEDKDKVKVYANFDDESKQELDHSWLVGFKPNDITGTDTPVTVELEFLGKKYTANVQVAESEGE